MSSKGRDGRGGRGRDRDRDLGIDEHSIHSGELIRSDEVCGSG